MDRKDLLVTLKMLNIKYKLRVDGVVIIINNNSLELKELVISFLNLHDCNWKCLTSHFIYPLDNKITYTMILVEVE